MSQKKTLLNLISTFTQNLQANAKMGLILSLLALYTLPSCEDPNRIGLDVQPEEDLINAIYVDNLPVKSYTMMRDSVYTYVQGNYLVGSYNDPQFGKVTAEAYGQMYIDNIKFLDNETRTLDSIVMVLDYSYGYGDTTKPQTFNIYQLQDTLASPLYSNTVKSINWSSLLGNITISKPNVGGTSSVVRIRLNNALGNQILSKQTWSYTEFSKTFPAWFVITPDTVNNSCILGFTVNSSTSNNSQVKVHYRSTVGGNTTAKVLSLNLNGGNSYNRVRVNRTGGLFNNLIASTSASSNVLTSQSTSHLVGIQSGTGMRAFVTFPFLDDIPQYFNGANKIKIVKAELVLKSQYATGNMSVPSVLYLSRATKDMRIPLDTLTPKSEVYIYYSSSLYKSYATALTKEDSLAHLYTYTLPLTWYFNNILQGQEKNNGLIISSASNQYSTSRLLFGDKENTTNPLLLKLYYIKLD